MTVIEFLRDGGVTYTLRVAAKWVYRKIRWCFPARRLKIRRARRTKSNSDCIWRPASSR